MGKVLNVLNLNDNENTLLYVAYSTKISILFFRLIGWGQIRRGVTIKPIGQDD